jgi:hypothetical protein
MAANFPDFFISLVLQCLVYIKQQAALRTPARFGYGGVTIETIRICQVRDVNKQAHMIAAMYLVDVCW